MCPRSSTREHVTLCWLGDSRAYWLAANPPTRRAQRHHRHHRRLRRHQDDSIAEEIVAAGVATMDEAMASPQAHVITRWLGADLPDPEPHVEQVQAAGPGVLLLCSDGLWNYRPEAARTGRPRDARRADRAARRRGGDLVKFAVDSGGLDNITVVLIPVPSPPSSGARGTGA